MTVTLNIIVLIFEILFYSLFMKFARKEGNFIRYIIAFTMVVLIGGITNVQTLVSYAIGLITILLTLKYVVKLKVSLYDLLFVFIMFFIKLLIELPVYMIFSNILNITAFYITMESVKIICIIMIRKEINKLYNYLKVKWDKNNFYIRYIFTTFMFLYFIFTALYLIVFYR